MINLDSPTKAPASSSGISVDDFPLVTDENFANLPAKFSIVQGLPFPLGPNEFFCLNAIRSIPNEVDRTVVSHYEFADKIQLLYSLLFQTFVLGSIVADEVSNLVGRMNFSNDEVQKYKSEATALRKDKKVLESLLKDEEEKSKLAITAQSKLQSMLGKVKEETIAKVFHNFSSYSEGLQILAVEKENRKHEYYTTSEYQEDLSFFSTEYHEAGFKACQEQLMEKGLLKDGVDPGSLNWDEALEKVPPFEEFFEKFQAERQMSSNPTRDDPDSPSIHSKRISSKIPSPMPLQAVGPTEKDGQVESPGRNIHAPCDDLPTPGE